MPVSAQDYGSEATRMVTVATPSPGAAGAQLCGELESGNILYFPQTPFVISEEDRAVLLGQKQTSGAFHKNVAYRPAEDRVTGLDKSESAEAEKLRGILQHYSQSAARFL